MAFTAVVNGIVVTECAESVATLVLHEGKILAILSPDADLGMLFGEYEAIDAAGQFVVPGGVDGHVHFGGFGDIPTMDDFYTGSKAALAGGTTTVVDFCAPQVGEDPLDCVRRRKEAGKDAAVDFALHYSFTEAYREELKRLPDIYAEGIRAFKAYTYYPNTSLLPGDFQTIMEHIHDGATLLVHAEEKSIIDCLKERYAPEVSGLNALLLTRPNISEQIAVESILALAKQTGMELCIAHSSSRETVAIMRRENATGTKKFHLESCPHYMEFTYEKMEGDDGALFTINPPLREQADADCLKQAMANGEIYMISTDHCSYSIKDKLGKNYMTVPCGVDGVQTRMQYCFSEAVLKRGASMRDFVRMTSANAAKYYGLYPRKGTIAVGSDADLAFFDPNAPEWIYSMDAVAGATDYSIFEGVRFLGKCTCTIKGGRIVMKDGIVTAERGSGVFLEVK